MKVAVNISSRRNQFRAAFLNQDLNPWKHSSRKEVSGCGKHERESKSVSCVFISRFISSVRVVGGDMSKLAVWILPQKGGICTTAQLLLHTEMFPPWSLCVSVESSKAQFRMQMEQMPCSVFLCLPSSWWILDYWVRWAAQLRGIILQQPNTLLLILL